MGTQTSRQPPGAQDAREFGDDRRHLIWCGVARKIEVNSIVSQVLDPPDTAGPPERSSNHVPKMGIEFLKIGEFDFVAGGFLR